MPHPINRSIDRLLHNHTSTTHPQPNQPGIGRHAALYLADQGGFLIFAGVRRPQDGEALQAAAADPQRIVPVILDVAKPVCGGIGSDAVCVCVCVCALVSSCCVL